MVIFENVKAPSLLLKALPVSAPIGHKKKMRKNSDSGSKGSGEGLKKP
jgi:hypothetical protein